MFQEYKQPNGQCNFSHNTMPVGKWFASHLTAYNSDKLSSENVDISEKVGFNWVVAHCK